MRRTRRVVLVLLVLILTAVGVAYKVQRGLVQRQAPALPEALPPNVSVKSNDWVYRYDDGTRTIVEVRAKDLEQIAGQARMQLKGVQLSIFHKDGKTFDRVKSERADFDQTAGSLFSDGDVEITMGVAAEAPAQPSGKLIVIRSSGVRFDSKTGKATTDRPASFGFDRGDGRATGAEYDPATRELRMHKDVSLTWRGTKPGAKVMVIEAGSLLYKESESKVFLSQWSRFKRETLTLNAADSVVTLNEGAIELVEAQKALGQDLQPLRNLTFGGDQLRMNFGPQGQVTSIIAEGNANLLSASDINQTKINTRRVDMEFAVGDGESTLSKATARGDSIVESAPIPGKFKIPPPTRILRSESILMVMRSNGEEIERIETHEPGTLQFLPNAPGGKRRFLSGERMWIHYGAKNQVESFRAVVVKTRTEAEAVKGQPVPLPSTTASHDMTAAFDPLTGEMTRLEQWQDFVYEEGVRHAKADKAILDSPQDRITLDGAARVWDPQGSTSARKIVLHQKAGYMEADGDVMSTRLPEKKSGSSGLLASDEAIQAKAVHMTSRNNNSLIQYEGNVFLWQAANRLQADRVDIDRRKGRIDADGKVVSQFVDKQQAKPAFTVVRAPKLVYTDEDGQAFYSGGSKLQRPGMTVEAREIRAFLQEQDADTTLDRAIADGAVKILQQAPERTRTGTSEHAEFYSKEGKVILQKGKPQLVDSVRGTTRGAQLTYFSGSDRLLVDGSEGQPANSQIRRK